MSVMRRRMLQLPDLGYIRDGLLAQYDGIYNTRGGHVPGATTWEDISGHGNDAQIYGAYDGMWANGALNYNWTLYALTPELALGNAFTVEIVTDGYSDDTRPVGYGYPSPFWCLSDNPTTWVSGLTTKNINFKSLKAGNRPTAAYNFGVITLRYGDGQASIWQPASGTVSQDGTTPSYAAQIYYLGGWGASDVMPDPRGRAWYGRMHGYRIYTRVLTDDEVAHNYAIDAARFCLESAGGVINS